MRSNTKNKKEETRGRPAKRETLEERVHRHLTDINSKITDDDILNVKTELEIRSGTNPEKQGKVKKETKRKSPGTKKISKADKDRRNTTPWDILSEGYD